METKGKIVRVSWMQSSTASKGEFHWKLLSLMPGGTEVEAAREKLVDGTVNYDALICFGEQGNPFESTEGFRMEGEAAEIVVEKARKGQSKEEWFAENSKADDGSGDKFGTTWLCGKHGKYGYAWGVGALGEYVYVVARAGEKLARLAWTPVDYRAWVEAEQQENADPREGWRKVPVRELCRANGAE